MSTPPPQIQVVFQIATDNIKKRTLILKSYVGGGGAFNDILYKMLISAVDHVLRDREIDRDRYLFPKSIEIHICKNVKLEKYTDVQ